MNECGSDGRIDLVVGDERQGLFVYLKSQLLDRRPPLGRRLAGFDLCTFSPGSAEDRFALVQQLFALRM